MQVFDMKDLAQLNNLNMEIFLYSLPSALEIFNKLIKKTSKYCW